MAIFNVLYTNSCVLFSTQMRFCWFLTIWQLFQTEPFAPLTLVNMEVHALRLFKAINACVKTVTRAITVKVRGKTLTIHSRFLWGFHLKFSWRYTSGQTRSMFECWSPHIVLARIDDGLGARYSNYKDFNRFLPFNMQSIVLDTNEVAHHFCCTPIHFSGWVKQNYVWLKSNILRQASFWNVNRWRKA